MLTYLADYGYKHMWCNPYMDTPSVFQPHRLTNKRGVKETVKLPWDSQRLPTDSDTYHVYKLGQLPPSTFGIETSLRSWVDLATVSNDNNLLIELYTQNGRVLAKSLAYMMVSANRTVIVAIKTHAKLPPLGEQRLYMRFYHNSYISSDRSANHSQPFIVTKGGSVDTPAIRLDILNTFYNYQQEVGHVRLMKNGYEHGYLTPADVEIGDVLEMTYQSTVSRTVDFVIKDLPTFNSTLDNSIKYLLHPPKNDNNRIDYHDDIDIVLLVPSDVRDDKFKGVYYHFNTEQAIRMVTHHDYSVPTALVDAFLNEHGEWLNTNNAILRLYIKESGYNRPLVLEDNRIHEMYKLDDDAIVNVLTGVNSSVGVWDAAYLEASSYPAIMRYKEVPGEVPRVVDSSVFTDLVIDTLGYNALVKTLGNTPLATVDDGGSAEVHLPPLYRENATVYEYTEDGRLLGFYYHAQGNEYYPRHEETRRVEAVRGTMTRYIDQTVNYTYVDYDPNKDYRFYLLTAVEESEVDGEWIEVTGNDEYYAIEDNRIIWKVDTRLTTPLVRSDAAGLGFTLPLNVSAGVITVPLTATYYVKDELTSNQPIILPLGKVDVWLNGYPLIRKIDYHVTDDNVIVITNKSWVIEGRMQTVTVRAAGHLNDQMQEDVDYEIGHVRHGKLSRNNRFDIRDDRTYRVIANGALKLPEELSFAEDDDSVDISNVREGAPYILEYLHPPLWELYDHKDYVNRQTAKDIDTQMSNLLSDLLPEAQLSAPIAVSERYVLYSPFLSAMIMDMVEKRLTALDGRMTDKDIEGIVHPYLVYLPYDPTQLNLAKDLVSIHPHCYRETVSLSIAEYSVLDRISRKYLNGRVDLTQFVCVGA